MVDGIYVRHAGRKSNPPTEDRSPAAERDNAMCATQILAITCGRKPSPQRLAHLQRYNPALSRP
jgi:hypothetical protein